MRELRGATRFRARSMPAVGTRKSTRAFVAKFAAAAAAEDDAVSLRSGRRLVLSKSPGKKVEAGGVGDDLLKLLDGVAAWWDEDDHVSSSKRVTVSNGTVYSMDEAIESPVKKRFGRAYYRKRKRLPADYNPEDLRYGVAYARRRDARGLQSRSRSPSVEEDRFEIAASSMRFAEEKGVPGNDLWWGGSGHVTLILVLVDSSMAGSVSRFAPFFISVLTEMRKKMVKLRTFAHFLLSKEICNAFSSSGIHFLPVKFDHDWDGLKNAQLHVGMCVISGSFPPVPRVSVNFSALPFYFKSLHMGMFLRSRFLPALPLSSHGTKRANGKDFVHGVFVGSSVGVHDSIVTDSSKKLAISESPVVGDAEIGDVGNDTSYSCSKFSVNGGVCHLRDQRLASRSGMATRRSMITRSQRRRTSLRSSRRRSSHNPNRNFSSIFLRQKGKPSSKPSSLNRNPVEFDEVMDAERVLSLGSSDKMDKKPLQRRSDDKVKEELKSLEAEIKQNIDSKTCKASILVIAADRCWKEQGAEVMMESCDSGDWCLVVKLNGLVRYLHKPQEIRSSVTNRYSHSMIWTGESCWKLEFDDRRDWFIFKHLIRECLKRNLPDVPAISIPVPGIRVISDYEVEGQGQFVRPDDYIKTKGTEVERVLASEITYYDMDAGDEEWLKQFNSSAPQESGSATQLPNDNFEKIMYSFEKAVYNNHDGVLNQGAATGLCLDLADKETVAAVFGYWSKKKKHKRTPLVRFFQEYPVQKMHATQGALLRRKRSLKKQGSSSNLGRGKPAFYLQAGAKQEELRQVRESEADALRKEDLAIKLRSKAQMLMSNADLLTYKSLMAVRFAEAIRKQESPDMHTIL